MSTDQATITIQQRRILQELGYSDAKITKIEPNAARRIIAAAEAINANGDGKRDAENTESVELRAPSKRACALAYARHGIRVFPCNSIEADGECSCGKLDCSSAAKHPCFSGWQTAATTNPEQIAAWWKENPDANVGVACGEASDLTVLDVDGDLGHNTLRDLEIQHGELLQTPMALTQSGGVHYYFKFEPDVGNAVRFAPGLDVRTEGGLVVGGARAASVALMSGK